jgi:CheY-like chemotaxis protein
MKILVVDDDELNCKILLDILQDAGYAVRVAQDGKEALAALDADPEIGVVLLDRMMPNMDGMDFLQCFENHPLHGRTKIIMQTAANQPKDVLEGTAAGVYYYLTKPFDETMALNVVEAAYKDALALRAA